MAAPILQMNKLRWSDQERCSDLLGVPWTRDKVGIGTTSVQLNSPPDPVLWKAQAANA